MKSLKFTLLLIIGLFAFVIQGKSQVNPSNIYVPGYTRSDGTHINGYYKTTPNSSNRDNYTTKPNVNPYTGKAGTINPDNKPLTTNSSYSTTPAYTAPAYSSPSYPSSGVSTGSRGGQYYINGNGNKTYIKH